MKYAFEASDSTLKKAADYSPTQQTASLTLQELYKAIKRNTISIPLWQRSSSWTLAKRIELMNYQLLGKAPISPISVNAAKNDEPVQQIAFVTRVKLSNDEMRQIKYTVIDGQQRVSTNYLLFHGDEIYDNVVLDLVRQKFRLIKSETKKITDIPVKLIFNDDSKEGLIEYLKANDLYDKAYDVLSDVRRKFQTYSYTFNVATDMTEEEQIHWFEILNKAGHKVSVLQTAFAHLKIGNIDIYDYYIEPFEKLLVDFGYLKLFGTQNTRVSYPFAALNPAYEVLCKNKVHSSNYAPFASDAKETIINKIANKNINLFIELMDWTLTTLKLTLEFIEINDIRKNIHRIDYISYILGYFIFKGKDNFSPTEFDIQYLKHWAETVEFTDRNEERRQTFSDLIEPLIKQL